MNVVPYMRGGSVKIKPTKENNSERSTGKWKQSPDESLVCA